MAENEFHECDVESARSMGTHSGHLGYEHGCTPGGCRRWNLWRKRWTTAGSARLSGLYEEGGVLEPVLSSSEERDWTRPAPGRSVRRVGRGTRLAHELMSSLHLYAVAHPERRPDDCSVVGSLGQRA